MTKPIETPNADPGAVSHTARVADAKAIAHDDCPRCRLIAQAMAERPNARWLLVDPAGKLTLHDSSDAVRSALGGQTPPNEAPAKVATPSEAPAKAAPPNEAPAKAAAPSEAPAKAAPTSEAPAKAATTSEAPAKAATPNEATPSEATPSEATTNETFANEATAEPKSETGDLDTSDAEVFSEARIAARSRNRRWVAAIASGAAVITAIAFFKSPNASAPARNPAPEMPVAETTAAATPKEAVPSAVMQPALTATAATAAESAKPTPSATTVLLPLVPSPATSVASAAPPPRTAAVTPPATASNAAVPTNELLKRALKALREQDFATAKRRYAEVLAREPNNVEAQNGLGDVALASGDPQTAKNHFASAVASHPSFFPAQLSLADVLWQLGDRQQARARYVEIVSRFGDRVPDRARRRAVNPSEPL